MAAFFMASSIKLFATVTWNPVTISEYCILANASESLIKDSNYLGVADTIFLFPAPLLIVVYASINWS